MLVEMYDNNRYWCHRDENNIEWITTMVSGGVKPLEVKIVKVKEYR